jgi:WD40 repeat protein
MHTRQPAQLIAMASFIGAGASLVAYTVTHTWWFLLTGALVLVNGVTLVVASTKADRPSTAEQSQPVSPQPDTQPPTQPASRRWTRILIPSAVAGAALIVALIVTRPAGDEPTSDRPTETDLESGDSETPAVPIQLREQAAASGWVNAVAFSPDSRLLALALGQQGRGTIEVWDLRPDTGTEHMLVATYDQDSQVSAIAFSPDGLTLAAATDSGTISLWDPTSQAPLATFPHERQVTSVAFSPDGTLLAAGTTGVRTTQIEGPNGPLEVGAPIWSVELWDPATGNHVATLSDNRDTGLFPALALDIFNPATPVAFSPDGSLLANGFAYGYSGALVHLWDPHSHQLVATLTDEVAPADDPVWARTVAFSPDGRILAAGGVGGSGFLWDLANRQQAATFGTTSEYGDMTSVAFSPDGTLLANGDTQRTGEYNVDCWSVGTGDLAAFNGCLLPVEDEQGETVGIGAHRSQINSVAFSPDGTLLAAGDHDGALWIYPNPTTPIPADPD